jgi:hypothetical protein
MRLSKWNIGILSRYPLEGHALLGRRSFSEGGSRPATTKRGPPEAGINRKNANAQNPGISPRRSEAVGNPVKNTFS